MRNEQKMLIIKDIHLNSLVDMNAKVRKIYNTSYSIKRLKWKGKEQEDM